MKVCAEEGPSESHRETTEGLSAWDCQASSIHTLDSGQGWSSAPPGWGLQPGRLPPRRPQFSQDHRPQEPKREKPT